MPDLPKPPITWRFDYAQWRLFVNVTQEELHGSAGLGRRRTVKKEM